VSTTTPSKTKRTALFAWADVATGVDSIGATLDVSTVFSGGLTINIGRRSGSAFTAGWPNVVVMGTSDTATTDCWAPLFSAQPAVGASIANTTLSAVVNAGATQVVVASASNIAAGDLLLLADTAAANYEVVRVKSLSSTTITLWEGVQHGHASGAAVTDQAEQYAVTLDLTGVKGLRVVVDNANSGQTCAADVQLVTLDSLSTA
jgi:hypothetical protein